MPKLTIPEKLEPFLTKKKRFKVAIGGRGGAKSQSFADLCLHDVQTQGLKLACFRELQNSIEDSVHSLLAAEIKRMRLDGFNVLQKRIEHEDGGEIRYKGLAKNPDAVKSMHGFKRFWVEEAQSVSQISLRKLTPTAREKDSEIWLSLNPQSSEDPVSKRFILPFQKELLKNGYYEDEMHIVVMINYCDNPWFPDVLEQERSWDYKNLSRAEYDHIWLGKFNDSIDNSVIKAEWFDAAIDAHKKLGFKARGEKVVTFDPSDSGDPRALCVRHGSIILDAIENDKDDVNDSCDWALDVAIKENADIFRWDVGGLGLTLKRQVHDSLKGKGIQYQMFNGANSPENPNQYYQEVENSRQQVKNKDYFYDKTAQATWYTRDRFYRTYRAVEHGDFSDPTTLISISSSISDIQKLRSETCRIPKKPNGNGLIQMMSKSEMKNKYKIESPNLWDSLKIQFDDQQSDSNDFLRPLNISRKYVY